MAARLRPRRLPAYRHRRPQRAQLVAHAATGGRAMRAGTGRPPTAAFSSQPRRARRLPVPAVTRSVARPLSPQTPTPVGLLPAARASLSDLADVPAVAAGLSRRGSSRPGGRSRLPGGLAFGLRSWRVSPAAVATVGPVSALRYGAGTLAAASRDPVLSRFTRDDAVDGDADGNSRSVPDHLSEFFPGEFSALATPLCRKCGFIHRHVPSSEALVVEPMTTGRIQGAATV